MNEIALLIAATLASGTPVALAGLGLLLNEKAGVLNLGAEGMMLVAAIAGFAVAFHTGNDWVAFGAGALAGAARRGDPGGRINLPLIKVIAPPAQAERPAVAAIFFSGCRLTGRGRVSISRSSLAVLSGECQT